METLKPPPDAPPARRRPRPAPASFPSAAPRNRGELPINPFNLRRLVEHLERAGFVVMKGRRGPAVRRLAGV